MAFSQLRFLAKTTSGLSEKYLAIASTNFLQSRIQFNVIRKVNFMGYLCLIQIESVSLLQMRLLENLRVCSCINYLRFYVCVIKANDVSLEKFEAPK